MVRRSVHKFRFDASVIARIIGSFDLRPVSRRERAAGSRTHVTPLSGARSWTGFEYEGCSKVSYMKTLFTSSIQTDTGNLPLLPLLGRLKVESKIFKPNYFLLCLEES